MLNASFTASIKYGADLKYEPVQKSLNVNIYKTCVYLHYENCLNETLYGILFIFYLAMVKFSSVVVFS